MFSQQFELDPLRQKLEEAHYHIAGICASVGLDVLSIVRALPASPLPWNEEMGPSECLDWTMGLIEAVQQVPGDDADMITEAIFDYRDSFDGDDFQQSDLYERGQLLLEDTVQEPRFGIMGVAATLASDLSPLAKYILIKEHAALSFDTLCEHAVLSSRTNQSDGAVMPADQLVNGAICWLINDLVLIDTLRSVWPKLGQLVEVTDALLESHALVVRTLVAALPSGNVAGMIARKIEPYLSQLGAVFGYRAQSPYPLNSNIISQFLKQLSEPLASDSPQAGAQRSPELGISNGLSKSLKAVLYPADLPKDAQLLPGNPAERLLLVLKGRIEQQPCWEKPLERAQELIEASRVCLVTVPNNGALSGASTMGVLQSMLANLDNREIIIAAELFGSRQDAQGDQPETGEATSAIVEQLKSSQRVRIKSADEIKKTLSSEGSDVTDQGAVDSRYLVIASETMSSLRESLPIGSSHLRIHAGLNLEAESVAEPPQADVIGAVGEASGGEFQDRSVAVLESMDKYLLAKVLPDIVESSRKAGAIVGYEPAEIVKIMLSPPVLSIPGFEGMPEKLTPQQLIQLVDTLEERSPLPALTIIA